MCAEVHRGSVNLYGIVYIYKVGSSQSAFAYAGIGVQADGRVVGMGMGGEASGVCRHVYGWISTPGQPVNSLPLAAMGAGYLSLSQ